MDLRNAEHYAELAKAVRQRADTTEDRDLARRLREVAVRHERYARRLVRLGSGF
jgi:hypothetical protein